jgi:hypothetical protein
MDSLDVLSNATTRPASVPSPPPNRTTVVEDLLQTLEHEGVRHLFGVPDGAIVPLYAALARGGAIRPVLAKHELRCAAFPLQAQCPRLHALQEQLSVNAL